MRPPTQNQQVVADACKTMPAADVAKRFGISVKRVHQLRSSVEAYAKWEAASNANEKLPVEQRLIELLPISSRAVAILTGEGYVTVGDLEALSFAQIIAIPGTGKATAGEIKSYLIRHMPSNAGVLERLIKRVALQARLQDDMRPAHHPEVQAWVERNWPELSNDARAMLNDLRKLPIVIAQRAAAAEPGVSPEAAARIWRAAIDAILSR